MSRQRWWTLLERGDGIRGWFSTFWERIMLNESGKSASVLCVVMHECHIPLSLQTLEPFIVPVTSCTIGIFCFVLMLT